MLDIFSAALAALIVRDVILEVYLTVKSDLIGKRVSKNLINLVEDIDKKMKAKKDTTPKKATPHKKALKKSN